jgi:hypothetical protein
MVGHPYDLQGAGERCVAGAGDALSDGNGAREHEGSGEGSGCRESAPAEGPRPECGAHSESLCL